jgi:hypothetical protein
MMLLAVCMILVAAAVASEPVHAEGQQIARDS